MKRLLGMTNERAVRRRGDEVRINKYQYEFVHPFFNDNLRNENMMSFVLANSLFVTRHSLIRHSKIVIKKFTNLLIKHAQLVLRKNQISTGTGKRCA